MGRERKESPAGEMVPDPPDSGWAWVVLVGSFVLALTRTGLLTSMSVYVYMWMIVFDGGAAETSLVVTVCSFTIGFWSEYMRTNEQHGGIVSSYIWGEVDMPLPLVVIKTNYNRKCSHSNLFRIYG